MQQSITTNTLFYGDNLAIMREYIPYESIDLVYLDPPFNSNRTYNYPTLILTLVNAAFTSYLAVTPNCHVGRNVDLCRQKKIVTFITLINK